LGPEDAVGCAGFLVGNGFLQVFDLGCRLIFAAPLLVGD
jgi:hypothetical protein